MAKEGQRKDAKFKIAKNFWRIEWVDRPDYLEPAILGAFVS